MSSPPPRRPRLIVVGATYTTVENRKKMRALAEHFDVLCVTGDRYVGYGLENRLDNQPAPEGYRLKGLPCVGSPQSTTRYRLAGLGETLRREPPADFVLVESEPWAQIRWQTWRAARWGQPGAKFGEFSWENARRTGWKGLLLDGFYRGAVRTADFVIAGNAEAGEFFRAAGLPGDRLLVAPQLGVDPAVFHPPADGAERRALRTVRGLPEDGFLVGFSGRLEEEKGIWDLVAAVERWRATRADPVGRDVHLALLGHGELIESLRERASTAPWLHVFGPCTHPEMADFMRLLDVFALPSRELDRGKRRWKEQFGHVLIEAMACGVATIGADSGAIPEVLDGGGRIFPSGNVPALVETLQELRENAVARTALAIAGRERTLLCYTHVALARTWAEFMLRGWSAGAR